MNPIGISIVRTDEASVYANYYYDEGPTVYIEILGINSPNSEWRISGRHSLGDTEIYLYGQGLGTFSFDSSDKKSYVLQIQNWNNDWVNSTNMYGEPQENSIINVDFENGGNGGDSGDGSWEEAGKNKLHINEGNGTKITVLRTWTDYYGGVGALQDGADIWYPADRFQITAEALPGYKIDYYTSDDGEYLPFIVDNLTKPYAGEPYQLSSNSDVTVSTTATRSTNIRIDDGSTFDNKYWCYIDTEHVVYPADGLYCSVVGQRTCRGYSNVSLENDYNTESSGCWGSYTPGGGGKMYFSYHMKFKTPEYIDYPANLTISIKMKGMELGFSGAADPDPTMRYAICSSDANYQLYAQTTSPVTDEFQIISGTFAENTTDGGVSNIVIKNAILDPDTTYYLIIWDANYMSSGRQTNIYPASEHNIVVELAGSDPIYYTKFDLYIPYIDNGTSWDPL